MYNSGFGDIERKIIGHLIKKGKLSVALKVWTNTLEIIRTKVPMIVPIDMFLSIAIDNISPTVILVNRKRGGTVYQIPYLVQNSKRDSSALIAIRALIKAAYSRLGDSFSEKLAKELVDAFNKAGLCFRRKQEVYQLSLKNRIYVKYLFSKKRRFRPRIR